MENNEPSYYAVIPASVRYDKRLNGNAKLLYGEITCLCNKEGYCWASNSYFANLYGVSNRSIINWINTLEECGYITKEIIYKDKSKEVETRILRINSSDVKNISEPVEENFTSPSEENFTSPNEKNFMDNNTSKNTIKSNNKKNKKEKILDEILAKFSLYDFSYTIQERLLDFYSDKIDAKQIPTENQLIATLDLLASVSESMQLQAINNSIRGGWKTIYLPDNKTQSYVLNKNNDSYETTQQKIKENYSQKTVHKF